MNKNKIAIAILASSAMLAGLNTMNAMQPRESAPAASPANSSWTEKFMAWWQTPQGQQATAQVPARELTAQEKVKTQIENFKRQIKELNFMSVTQGRLNSGFYKDLGTAFNRRPIGGGFYDQNDTDLLWSALPSDAQEAIKKEYQQASVNALRNTSDDKTRDINYWIVAVLKPMVEPSAASSR